MPYSRSQMCVPSRHGCVGERAVGFFVGYTRGVGKREGNLVGFGVSVGANVGAGVGFHVAPGAKVSPLVGEVVGEAVGAWLMHDSSPSLPHPVVYLPLAHREQTVCINTFPIPSAKEFGGQGDFSQYLAPSWVWNLPISQGKHSPNVFPLYVPFSHKQPSRETTLRKAMFLHNTRSMSSSSSSSSPRACPLALCACNKSCKPSTTQKSILIAAAAAVHLFAELPPNYHSHLLFGRFRRFCFETKYYY